MHRQLSSLSVSLPALDVFRGWAAILMIVNHAGYRLLSASDSTPSSLVGAMVYLGSFAPALFFFATGMGIGLSTRARLHQTVSILPAFWKGILLLLADQLLWYGRGFSFGLDFLGFIGIATIVISMIARLRKPVIFAIGLVALMFFIRYALGSVYKAFLPDIDLLHWAVGVKGLKDVSYPLTPWMIYPLLGFVLARTPSLEKINEINISKAWLHISTATSIVFFVGALILFLLNQTFFRWGTVSFGFFILSLGVISISCVLAYAVLYQYERVGILLSLRGVSSFVIIPVHYALLEICSRHLLVPTSQYMFVSITFGLIFITFSLSNQFSKTTLKLSKYSNIITPISGLIVVNIFVIQYLYPAIANEYNYAFTPLGQLLIAYLLVIRTGMKNQIHR